MRPSPIRRIWTLVTVLVFVAGAAGLLSTARAQEPKPASGAGEAPAPEPAENAPQREPAGAEQPTEGAPGEEGGEASPAGGSLESRQENVSRRFKQFEKTLLQMGEYMRKTEPERADLLFRARSRGQEVRVAQQMDQIIALLKKQQFGDAVEQQADLVKHLREMLELLQSEDRRSELEKEKDRIQNLLKELNKNIAAQKDVRAQTERGGDPDQLSDKQQKVAEGTGKLGQKIDKQDAERNGENSPKDSKSKNGSDAKSKDGKGEKNKDDGVDPKEDPKEPKSEGDEGKPSESKDPQDPKDAKDPKSDDPNSDKPGSKEPKPGKEPSPDKQSGKPKDGKSEGKDSQPGQPQEGQEGQPQEGEKSEGEQQDQQQSQNSPSGQSEKQKKTPGREEIEKAKKEMEQAIEKLKKLNADEASGHQDEAVRKLQEAKDKLEEILRQLREEERELMLAALEARFQKMLALQLAVHTGTVALDKTPKKEWTARHFGSARSLGNDEDAIALEAAKALTLLKEEGSSVAFPEGVEQIRDDMLSVARMLERTEVGELVQATQKDIIESLEELIEALQKEMEKKKNDQQQQQQQQQQQSQDDNKALVDEIAELKMLRSLQLRINRRTKRLGSMVKGEQASEPEVVEQLQSLSRRQSQVQQATHNLATGKNK